MAGTLRIRRIEFIKGSFNALRTDPKVMAELLERGEKIAAEATANAAPRADLPPALYGVDASVVGKSRFRRARVGIYTTNLASMLDEAEDRTLSRALDAGR